MRSKSEKWIADALFLHSIPYVYEKSLDIGKYTFKPDFYLPEFDIYLEFYGLISDTEYNRTHKWKKKMYGRHKIRCVPIYPRHIKVKPKEFIQWLVAEIKKRNDL